MNWWLFSSILIGIILLFFIIYWLVGRVRKANVKKHRTSTIVRERFKKKTRSSEGSPY